MVHRVASTKLTEEEFSLLKEMCQKHGYTTSGLIKEAITKWIELDGAERKDLETFSKTRLHPPYEGGIPKQVDTINNTDFFQYYRKRIETARNNKSHEWF